MSHDNIPTYEPDTITAGETLEWTKALTDFSASDGWVLVYYFRGAGPGFDVTAVAASDGTSFAVSVPATTTETLTAGRYYWQAFAVKNAEPFLADSGEVTVRASLSAIATTVTVDNRSQAKQILDAIDAMVLGKATRDQQEYMIGNRSLKRIPIPDLIALRTRYAQIYAQEQRRARTKRGGTYLQNINTRFDKPR